MDNVIYSIKELKVRKRENPKHQRWPILLENAAGEGSKFGSTMQDLKYLFDNLQDEGVGFCLDTAHCFAAGMFDLESKESIVEMFEVIEEDLGKDRLQLVHLNDSKIPFGGCNDRHECLGEGYIWKDSIDSCRILLQECRTRGIDVVLETPDVVRDYQLGCKLLRDEESCSSSSAETS
jgi:deoxyribonuclease-4